MNYIIDTYAWIEYFIGSKKGEVLKKLFSDEKNNFFTIACSLAEIRSWALMNDEDFDKLYKIMQANSTIIDVTQNNWIETGRERFKQRRSQKDFGMIDAILLVKQKESNSKLITGDKHFKIMKDVIFLE